MDNHLHLVAIPEHADSLAITMRRTQGRYSLFLNARKLRTGHLWQNRFYSCPLDEAHRHVALRYVERNPVRAKMVTKPEDYKWSSAAAHLGTAAWPTWLDEPCHSLHGGQEGWKALLAEPEELITIRNLQRGTFTGRPVGSEPFVKDLEQLLGRPLRSHQGKRSPLRACTSGVGTVEPPPPTSTSTHSSPSR